MTALLPEITPALGVLGASGAAVCLSGRREFVRRWASFAGLAPALFLASMFGTTGAAALAAVIATTCGWEYARITRLDRMAHLAMQAGSLSIIGLAYLGHGYRPQALLLISVAVPVLLARASDGHRQAAFVGWGALWLGSSLATLVTIGHVLVPLTMAVSVGDVAAYFGGSLARKLSARLPVLGTKLNPLSPNKTWLGFVVGSLAALSTLAVLGALTPARALAVTAGAVLGDLVESMVKRGNGVKDAGSWLPGFGGLLDRVDSLIGALLVLAVLA